MQAEKQTVLITGGASGIGAAVARLFIGQGAQVAIADIHFEQARALAAELGDNARPFALDVGDAGNVRSLVAQLGKVDVLVNSAGILLNKPFLDTEPEDFERLLRVNLLGTCLVAREAARNMLGRGGRIINVASAAGLLGFPGRTAYAASKGAVIAATRVMALELAEHGILVNAIAPGSVATAMTAATYDERFRRSITASVPLARVASPEEIAEVAVFLASPAASYITGQTFAVDGGMSSTGMTCQSLQQD
ncbi:3-oxoacyl-[acyl-carrier protein] reductase [Pseudomonas citronellolis]|uniref:3-oxoacyl-[acyl-carrier protein] reductase n=1 Tax=Pseudomonas citronellolis TaxID=53408 RepID=A0AAQ1KNY7_9PSED|nr:SDR family NAD(P)-dependent oxidoreductase [Pseudomonas citronellolis]TGC25580.1 NAD(P)-dependent oxidoreductase [Pseudomonas citronellolis]SFD93074.1 3-oxoacyl-[acyl-carrier protein] reductase [Pseudomonas citronellolis]